MSPWLWGLAFLLGLGLRLVLIGVVTEPIDRDAEEYYTIAQNITDGHGFSIDGENPTARRSPGYPAFLATVIAIFGKDPTTVYVIQALINILTIWLTSLCMKRMSVRPVIVLGVTVLFLLSSSFVFVNVLYAEVLTMFFVALLLIMVICYDQSYDLKDPTALIFTGLILGGLIYLRPTFLYFPGFLLLCGMIFTVLKRRVVARFLILSSVLSLLLILPWTIRNYRAFHQFIPVVSAGGTELWMANVEIPMRTVWYSVTDIQEYENQRIHSSHLQSQLILDYKRDYNLTNQEDLNRFLGQRAFQNALDHPFRYLLLSFNRFLIFWYSPPIGSTTLKSLSSTIFWTVMIIHYVFITIVLAGIFLLFKQAYARLATLLLLVVYLTLLHAFTHAIQRYFLPLLPFYYFVFAWTWDQKILPLLSVVKHR